MAFKDFSSSFVKCMFTGNPLGKATSKKAEILVQAKLIALLTSHPNFYELRQYAIAILNTLKHKILFDPETLLVKFARDLRQPLNDMNFEVLDDGALQFKRGDIWLNKTAPPEIYNKYRNEILSITELIAEKGRLITLDSNLYPNLASAFVSNNKPYTRRDDRWQSVRVLPETKLGRCPETVDGY
jgi:hypothetical protein